MGSSFNHHIGASMKGPIPVMPMEEVKSALGLALDDNRVKKDPKMLLICLSITEYMKDAERWQWVRDNQGGVPEFESPQAVTDYVDCARGAK